ncbi:MAG: phosphate signaling complex protein PhoU [Thermaerobacter sp.]|jgi:phosphate transport system protein|nr:phosphate signaling complex protein PhoU [Thermaerobacter sp.]MDA8144435.1 phosphate signaling complex protein PhoU [Thermaerobacter sp.]
MRSSFHLELENLQQDVLKMGTLVEGAIVDAVRSLAQKDSELARKVLREDDLVDDLEMGIERRCLTLFALQQPMARDLRIIGTALKIITDLERMGDHACDIAKVTLRLENQPLIKPLIDIPRMAEIGRAMIQKALRAYMEEDGGLAMEMIQMDDQLDHLYKQIFRELLVLMMENPNTIEQAAQLLMVGQYLERIGDHATNLGEWILYMISGERKRLNK